MSAAIGSKEHDETEPVQKTAVLWQDRIFQTSDREFFTRGVGEINPDMAVIYARAASDIPDAKGVSCVVLTGAGADYIDKNPKVPLIVFSWLDPALMSMEVIAVFDDSPWALAAPAVRMAVAGQAEGHIPSKPFIFSAKIADNGIFRIMGKLAEKSPDIDKNLSETLTNN